MNLELDKEIYSAKELSDIFNIPHSTIKTRLFRMGYKKTKRINQYIYLVKRKDVEKVIENRYISKPIPEIIYVTRTTEIYQSKLNFLTLQQL